MVFFTKNYLLFFSISALFMMAVPSFSSSSSSESDSFYTMSSGEQTPEPEQGFLQEMGFERLRDLGLTGDGVNIAVIDATLPNGLPAVYHNDLPKDKIIPGFMPPIDHGARVASIIAGAPGTQNIYQGLAPNSHLLTFMPREGVKGQVLIRFRQYETDEPREGTVDQLAGGMNGELDYDANIEVLDVTLNANADQDYANFINDLREIGVRIINLSRIGLSGPITRQAIREFGAVGGLIVVGVGNSANAENGTGNISNDNHRYGIDELSGYFAGGDLLPGYGHHEMQDLKAIGHEQLLQTDPEYRNAFLLVGSYNPNEQHNRSTFSKYPGENEALKGRFVLAPGEHENLMTIDQNGAENYINREGTSYSAPVVSAGIALLYQAFRDQGVTPNDIAQAIRETAHNHGVPNAENGYGLINLDLAYQHFAGNN